MIRQVHDQFGKEVLAELFQRLGQVTANQEIHAEIYHADIGFIPSPAADPAEFQKLGRLGQMVGSSCLVEYFWKPPTLTEVRNALLKLFSWQASLQRAAKSKKQRIAEEELPRLWIITTSMPNSLFSKCSLTLAIPHWGAGIYFQEELWRTAVVAIDELPATPDTVWLRLLGKGEVQEQAVETVLTLVKTDPSLSNVLEIIYKWCTLLQMKPRLTEPEKELLMNLSTAYQEARQKVVQQGVLQGIQQGIQQGVQQGVLQTQRAFVESFIKSRFGKVDETLLKVIDPLAQFSPPEIADWLLHLSREELIAKFGNGPTAKQH